MNFGQVIEGLKSGRRYAREGWPEDDPREYLDTMGPGSLVAVAKRSLKPADIGEPVDAEDMFAEDWREVRMLGPDETALVADSSPQPE